MNEINDILEQLKMQVKSCIDDITGKLQYDLQKSAHEYGAIVRVREVSDASLLLQLLLIYAISDISQKMLALCGFLIGAGNISDQAWQKRF